MLILPEKLREEVRKPFGMVLGGSAAIEAAKASPRPLISVGDRCALDLIGAGVAPDMLIFDFKVKREEITPGMKRVLAPHAAGAFVVMSGAGSISPELEIAVSRMLSEGRGAVLVAGEDDLSALLVMARAKGGTLVYGQPGEGAVLVKLGEGEAKARAQSILKQMQKAEDGQ